MRRHISTHPISDQKVLMLRYFQILTATAPRLSPVESALYLWCKKLLPNAEHLCYYVSSLDPGVNPLLDPRSFDDFRIFVVTNRSFPRLT